MIPSNNKVEISVIIPLFNEEKSVTPLINAVFKAVRTLKKPFEVLLVDDGSKDQTFAIAKSRAQKHPNLRVIKFRKNYGQTPAMVAGIEHAKGNILITMDGDLQNDPADIPNFIKKINEGFDIVVGWRVKRQDKLISRKIPSQIANWLIGKVTGVPIKDNGCSLKAYRREVIQNVPLYSEMHRFIPAMASIMGARVAEIKVRHHARKFGYSKYGLSRIYKVLLDLLAIKTIISFSSKPMVIFGTLAFIFALMSLLTIIVGAIQVLATATVSVVVIVGTSMLSGILSFFLLFSGILCELIFRTGTVNINRFSQITAFADFKSTDNKYRRRLK
jgi:glycosyltransferase involved in cell wall biosynthesis